MTHVAVAVVFGVNDDAICLVIVRIDFNLHLGIRIHADVENLAVLGEPGVGPTSVVANADGCDTVDDP